MGAGSKGFVLTVEVSGKLVSGALTLAAGVTAGVDGVVLVGAVISRFMVDVVFGGGVDGGVGGIVKGTVVICIGRMAEYVGASIMEEDVKEEEKEEEVEHEQAETGQLLLEAGSLSTRSASAFSSCFVAREAWWSFFRELRRNWRDFFRLRLPLLLVLLRLLLLLLRLPLLLRLLLLRIRLCFFFRFFCFFSCLS